MDVIPVRFRSCVLAGITIELQQVAVAADRWAPSHEEAQVHKQGAENDAHDVDHAAAHSGRAEDGAERGGEVVAAVEGHGRAGGAQDDGEVAVAVEGVGNAEVAQDDADVVAGAGAVLVAGGGEHATMSRHCHIDDVQAEALGTESTAQLLTTARFLAVHLVLSEGDTSRHASFIRPRSPTAILRGRNTATF